MIHIKSEGSDPFSLEVVNHKNDRADRPGQRISPKYHVYYGDESYNYSYVGYSEETPAGEHDNHGNCRLSCASEYSCETVAKCQKEEEQTLSSGLRCTDCKNGRLA